MCRIRIGECSNKKSAAYCRERKEIGSRTRKKREQPRGSHLEIRKTAKRELCVKKKIERRVQSVAAFEKDN